MMYLTYHTRDPQDGMEHLLSSQGGGQSQGAQARVVPEVQVGFELVFAL